MGEAVKKVVSVIGSDGIIPDNVYGIAEVIGRELGEKGVVVVCGGRTGVMEAACKGAYEASGTSIAILPSLDRNEANKYADIVLPTGIGYARNIFISACPDAVIALAGSTGTLSEIALALNNNKHVFVVTDSGGVCSRFREILSDDARGELVHHVGSEEVVEKVLEFLGV